MELTSGQHKADNWPGKQHQREQEAATPAQTHSPSPCTRRRRLLHIHAVRYCSDGQGSQQRIILPLPSLYSLRWHLRIGWVSRVWLVRRWYALLRARDELACRIRWWSIYRYAAGNTKGHP